MISSPPRHKSVRSSQASRRRWGTWPERQAKPSSGRTSPHLKGEGWGLHQFHASSLPHKGENGTTNGIPGFPPLPQFHLQGGGDGRTGKGIPRPRRSVLSVSMRSGPCWSPNHGSGMGSDHGSGSKGQLSTASAPNFPLEVRDQTSGTSDWWFWRNQSKPPNPSGFPAPQQPLPPRIRAPSASPLIPASPRGECPHPAASFLLPSSCSALRKPRLRKRQPCWCSTGNEGMTLINHPLCLLLRESLGSFPHSRLSTSKQPKGGALLKFGTPTIVTMRGACYSS